MIRLAKHEWDLLRSLAGQARIAPERINVLQARWEQNGPRPGAPYTLLIGQPAVLELLLARWLGPEAAGEMAAAGDRPLVLGPQPDKVQPPLGRWPTRRQQLPGHVLVLRAAQPLTPAQEAALASLGFLDQAILVTSLSQPLSQTEREVAGSLRAIAATLRVLIVALPSDVLSPGEQAELTDYATAQMAAQGFGTDRCTGAAIWFTEGSEKRAGALSRIEEWLTPRETDVRAGRDGMLRQALDNLLSEIEKADVQQASIDVPDEDLDHCIGQFNHHLTGLGEKMVQMAELGEFKTTEQARRFFVDAVHGWTTGQSLPATTLTYAETVRPGVKAGLAAEVEAAASLLEYVPSENAKPLSPGSTNELQAPMSLMKHARSFLHAILIGVVTAVALFLLATLLLAPWLALPLSLVVGIVAALLAYIFRSRSFPLPVVPSPTLSMPPQKTPPALRGWSQIEQRLSTWFSSRLRHAPPSVQQECERLRAMWQLQENHR